MEMRFGMNSAFDNQKFVGFLELKETVILLFNLPLCYGRSSVFFYFCQTDLLLSNFSIILTSVESFKDIAYLIRKEGNIDTADRMVLHKSI